MAEETFQIKEEPLDTIYAAEMADDAATIITSSGVNVNGYSMNSSKSDIIKGTAYGTGSGACNRTNDIGGNAFTVMATDFSNNVKIKIEPDTDACAEEVLNNNRGDGVCGEIRVQELLDEQGIVMSCIQVKSEPMDPDCQTSNDFELLPPSQTNSTNTHHTEHEQLSSNDFEVVAEHENIITISAAELSTENSRVLELNQKLQVFNELSLPPYNTQPRRTKKILSCKLCAKRCSQEAHFAHHMEQHRRNRIFCARKMCDTWFSSLEDCERHEYESHEILQLKCNVCNHKFLGFDQLSQHKVKMHSKLHRFVCSICRDWFISLGEMREHWMYMPGTCGRLANIDSLEKTYKLKCAPTTPNPAGLKLKLLPATQISKQQAPLVSAIQNNAIEIKQEPMEPEAILPDMSSTNSSNIKLPVKYELVAGTNTKNSALPKLKLRLRKQPLSPKVGEDERSSSPPAMQVNPNPLGHLLARRITSRFSLKTVPKMFHLTNIANGNELQKQTPQQTPDPQTTLVSPSLQQPPRQPQPLSLQPNLTSQPLQSIMPLSTLKQCNANNNASKEPPKKMVKIAPKPPQPLQPQPNLTSQPLQQAPQQPQISQIQPIPNSQPLQQPTQQTQISQSQSILTSQPLQQAPQQTQISQSQSILTSQPLQQPTQQPQPPQPQPIVTSQPLQSLVPLSTLIQSNANNNTSNEPPMKMLKIAPNFRIVKLKSPTREELPSANGLSCPTTTMMTSAPTANVEQKVAPFMRQFTLENVVVPPLDKTVAIAKLESVTKTNKEISLTELLDEAIVREKNENAAACNNTQNTFYKIKLVTTAELQTNANIKTESEIKKEFIENVMALQNEESLSATNISDSSINSSNGNATMQAVIANEDKDNGANTKQEINVVKSNTGDGYVCPRCGRRYSTLSTVSEHLMSNCGRNLRHECDICHKCFFSSSTLNCHRTIHTGELPHKCNYCDKRFRTRGQVTVHHRTHTGERPFVCEICSQSFTHRETLISHLSRHIGMKRYKCYGCDKHFSCISGLSMHRATRQDTCGKFELNTRAVGPRVRVIRGRVVFEPQPNDSEDGDGDAEVIGMSSDKEAQPATVEVLAEIQNK